MAALLADALLQGARTAQDFLTPAAAQAATMMTTTTTTAASSSLSEELQARIETARDETLEYYRTHRLANTARNYAPKQHEWKAWCAAEGFPPGGSYLPGDWVDERKCRYHMTTLNEAIRTLELELHRLRNTTRTMSKNQLHYSP